VGRTISKLDLIVDLAKTRRLDVPIPPSLLNRADQVIESRTTAYGTTVLRRSLSVQ
jgi:hypothetical protein